MAIRNVTNQNTKDGNVRGSFRNYLWDLLALNDHGSSLECGDFTDKTIHFYGTWGVGGSITLYGSNNPADLGLDPSTGTWVVLVDPQGNAITKTANSMETILESPRYLAVKVTGGDGTTSLKANIVAKRGY